MHANAPALALAALLLSPAAAALAPPARALPPALPLELEAPGSLADLVVGWPVALPIAVRSSGLAGSGVQPMVARQVVLNASPLAGDVPTLQPNPVVLAPGEGVGNATLRFTPAVLGPFEGSIEARWELLPGRAEARLAGTVVKDDLAVEGLAAGAPDADLDLVLTATLRSGHHAAEPLAWSVEARHAPRNGTGDLTWTAAAGTGLASPGGEPWTAQVRARYGPGLYTFEVRAGGARLADAAASLAVDVPEVRSDHRSVDFSLEVPDAPTTLRLASDTVNADGKVKTPGNAVITRVVVGDGNGLGDVRRVTFAYARNESGTLVPVAARTVEAPGAGLEATVEDRFELSPMKDAAYVCTVTAEGTGTPAVQRTFLITDVLPDATLALAASQVLPARAMALNATLVVRDANFGTGPLDGSDITELGALQLKLLKGSTAVTEAGWALRVRGETAPAPLALDLAEEGTRSTALAYRVVDGKGTLEVPVQVFIPEGATSGVHRLSVAATSTLASAAFNVTPLPRITRLAPGPAAPGGTLTVEVEAAPVADLAALELRAPWGATLRAGPGDVVVEAGAWRWNASLPVPRPWDDEAAANLTAVADLGDGRVVLSPAGPPVNARTAALAVANAAPRLDAALRIGDVPVGDEAWVHPHSVGSLTARAAAGDDNALAADLRDELGLLEAEVRDWKGQRARFEVDGDFAPAGTLLAVQPLDPEPGHYALHLRVRDDDGAIAEKVLGVNVGVHFRLGFQVPNLTFAPDANGTLRAVLPLRNLGNAAAGRLAVLAEGLPPGAPASVVLHLANGTALRAPLVDGFARFEGAPRLVEPSEWARLDLAVDARQGVAAGHFEGRIVVAGEAA